jgi:hypothetical protein
MQMRANVNENEEAAGASGRRPVDAVLATKHYDLWLIHVGSAARRVRE